MALQNATILLIGRAPLVRQTLLQTGYQILWAESGARAMRQLQEEAIDLLVLDDELPDVSASEFLAYVRGYPTTRELPVMLLRGCFSVQDALDFRARGVTEYVTKPVAPSQLLLAIEAVLAKRKTSLVDATVVELGPFVIDMTARQLVGGGGQEELLSPLEFEVLTCLIQNAGRAVSYDELLRQVWGCQPDAGNREMVKACVKRLRRKVEENSAQPQYIRTVRGVGYRLVIPGS